MTDRQIDRLVFVERWTGGRVVEGTGLENRHTCKGIESSNLSLSVNPSIRQSVNQKGPRNSKALFSQKRITDRRCRSRLVPHRALRPDSATLRPPRVL